MNHKLTTFLDSMPELRGSNRKFDMLWPQIAIIICLTAVALGWAFGVNLKLQKEQLGNHRFSEIQLYSDRITDRLLSLQSRGQVISQIGVLRFLLNAPELDTEQLQSYLQGLTDKLEAIERIELYDSNNQVVASTLTPSPHYEGQADNRETQGEGQARYSPLLIDTGQHRVSHWQRVPVPANPHGVKYSAIYADLTPVLSAFYRVDQMGEIPLMLFDIEGKAFKLSHTGGNDRLSEQDQQRMAALWPQIQGQEFGQLNIEDRNFLFLRVKAGHFEPFYLVSYFDDHELLLLARDHRRIVGSLGLVLILFLCWLTIQKHGLQKQQGHFQLAMDVAEQLYQHAGSTLLFSPSGKLILANPSAHRLLGLKASGNQGLWFHQLFGSDRAQRGWEHTLEKGQWQGQLSPGGQDRSLAIELRHSSSNNLFPLVIANLQPVTDDENAYRSLTQSQVGLALMDNELNLQLCNASLREWLGRDADDNRPLPLDRLISLPEGMEFSDLQQSVARDGLWQQPVWLKTHHHGMQPRLASVNQGDDKSQWILTLQDRQGSDDASNPPLAGFREMQLMHQDASGPEALLNLRQFRARHQQPQSWAINQRIVVQHLKELAPRHSCIAQFGEELVVLLSQSSTSQAETLAQGLNERFEDTPVELRISATWLATGRSLREGLAQLDDANKRLPSGHPISWVGDRQPPNDARTYTAES
ncbi:PAS domain-containing protein [Ferrimonas kyonanensis]|uniref:PAS domain-containing protein n=1 Tax=Ferrimonas kyonanensis TaxID=364763 RepID=UPI000426430E|nr:PAS domain-containing protein [Ferrimonas kyonanensis]